MKKQTAVEYLVKELSEILGPLKTEAMQDLLLVDAINKAKEMEKQQITELLAKLDSDIAKELTFKPKQERMYSEEEVLQLLLRLKQTESYDNLYDWFEQFKKK